jgi:hypothetical protein
VGDDEDVMESFEVQMADVWTVEVELGFLVRHEDFQKYGGIPMERLMWLREEWPGVEEVQTTAESLMNHVLDTGIYFCLRALGLTWQTDEQGTRWFGFIDHGAEVQKGAAQAARRCLQLAESVIRVREELDDGALSDEMRAALAWEDASAAVEADATSDDDIPWWRILGWPSLQEWQAKHRNMSRFDA